jgi:hypothetical protein
MRGVDALPGKHIVTAFVLLGASIRLFEDGYCEPFRLASSPACAPLCHHPTSRCWQDANPALNPRLDFSTPVCPLRERQKQ